MTDRFLKRLRKKAKRGMRGCGRRRPSRSTGPGLAQATKVVVSIVPSTDAEPQVLRDWTLASGDVRSDTAIAEEIRAFLEMRGVLSVIMIDGIIGCPHQEGIDYEGDWCPVCTFWHGRTGSPANACTDRERGLADHCGVSHEGVFAGHGPARHLAATAGPHIKWSRSALRPNDEFVRSGIHSGLPQRLSGPWLRRLAHEGAALELLLISPRAVVLGRSLSTIEDATGLRDDCGRAGRENGCED